jgi:hypothetical protein
MGEIPIVGGHENCSNEFDVLLRFQARRPDASGDLISLKGDLIRKEFDLHLDGASARMQRKTHSRK